MDCQLGDDQRLDKLIRDMTELCRGDLPRSEKRMARQLLSMCKSSRGKYNKAIKSLFSIIDSKSICGDLRVIVESFMDQHIESEVRRYSRVFDDTQPSEDDFIHL